MNHHGERRFKLQIVFLFGLIILRLPGTCLAQTYKEVEVHVAGPWAYATDPDPSKSSQIIVVSPNANHLMTVISGGDANAFNGQLDAGIYTLSFTTSPCAKHRPVAPPKLYDVPTPSTTSAVADVLGSKGKNLRVAIYLPKPCYYESYRESHLKISTALIDERTSEGSFAIWTVLHYTIDTAAGSPTLSGILDSGNPFTQQTIPFANSVMPPMSEAIGVVAYYAKVGEDYPCDSHSAEHFDAAMSLWSQTGMFRLLPELDSKGNQSHRYNYNVSKCPQAITKQMNGMTVTADSLLKEIREIRADLGKSNLDPAIDKTASLRTTMLPLWNPVPPAEVVRDLDRALVTLKDLKDRHQTFPPSWVAQFLIVTEDARAPGRADCHAVQLNIDSTVP